MFLDCLCLPEAYYKNGHIPPPLQVLKEVLPPVVHLQQEERKGRDNLRTECCMPLVSALHADRPCALKRD